MNAPRLTLHDGYWCECWTQSPTTGSRPVLLASIEADTPRQAIGWIRTTLRTIALSLEAEARTQAWDWITTGHRTAVRDLPRGEPCAFTISHGATLIEWTARPVQFLPLAHRHGVQLPACAGRFARHQWPTE